MRFAALYPEFLVERLERSESFYVEVLGFEVEYRRPEESFVFLSFGEAQLMLLQDNEDRHSRTGPLEYPRGRGVNFSIATASTASMLRALEAGGHSPRIPVRDRWHRQDDIEHGERQLWVMDPDGYLLRFIESLGTRPFDPERAGAGRG